ncbi:MAG: bacillithiol biosynthesis cysteine-adding enzyme BshC [Balneolia bacterium]|nr:bacillithiol biosynthesis cysteine-adding enzyme BshC [Balneolia bacterium]
MDCTPVNYSELGFSRLFTDYLNENEEAHSFYNGRSPFQVGSFLKQAKARGIQSGVGREELSDLLMKFNAPFNPGEESIRNILALKDKDTFTVVTGQQLCLFGGPLYTLYKTVSAIALAKHLSEKTSLKVVPVFWLADEDHDFEEISFTNAFSKDHELIKAGIPSTAFEGHSAGRLQIDEHTEQAKSLLAEILGASSDQFKEVNKLISDWTPGAKWRTSFGRMMMKLFGSHGLVLAGSDDSGIKNALSPVLKKSIAEAAQIYDKLESQSSAVGDKYHVQAVVSESQFFWHDEKEGRVKIPFESGKCKLPGLTGSLSDIDASEYISEHGLWEKLSPNVFMRPVLQEYLLPNLAYIGGGAELAYHAQMKSLFAHFEMEMPLLLPRLGATVLDYGTKRVMKEAGFPFTDYKRPVRELQRDWVTEFAGYEVNETFEKWERELQKLFAEKEPYISDLDKSLGKSAKSTQVRIEHELESLRKKMIRSVKNREEVQMSRIRRIGNTLFPNGVLQEREVGFVFVIAAHGRVFSDSLVNIMAEEPFRFMKAHQIIEP